MSNIVYNENSQKFLVLPDGDTATHKQIKEEYDSRIRNMVPKDKIERLIKLIEADIQFNERAQVKTFSDPVTGAISYRQNKVIYTPETVKKHLERLL